MSLSGRLLPERTIRPSHALETETTRHRITSFRFVEHAIMMGLSGENDKGADENSVPTKIVAALAGATKPLWQRERAVIMHAEPQHWQVSGDGERRKDGQGYPHGCRGIEARLRGPAVERRAHRPGRRTRA